MVTSSGVLQEGPAGLTTCHGAAYEWVSETQRDPKGADVRLCVDGQALVTAARMVSVVAPRKLPARKVRIEDVVVLEYNRDYLILKGEKYRSTWFEGACSVRLQATVDGHASRTWGLTCLRPEVAHALAQCGELLQGPCELLLYGSSVMLRRLQDRSDAERVSVFLPGVEARQFEGLRPLPPHTAFLHETRHTETEVPYTALLAAAEAAAKLDRKCAQPDATHGIGRVRIDVHVAGKVRCAEVTLEALYDGTYHRSTVYEARVILRAKPLLPLLHAAGTHRVLYDSIGEYLPHHARLRLEWGGWKTTPMDAHLMLRSVAPVLG